MLRTEGMKAGKVREREIIFFSGEPLALRQP